MDENGSTRRGVVSGHRRLLATAAVVLAVTACSRLYVRTPGTTQPVGDPSSVVYLVGDFGEPGAQLADLMGSIAADAALLAPGTSAIILELGDNLYEQGLPTERSGPGGREALERLEEIAQEFAKIQRPGRQQVPLVLIPGNHDYAGDALASSGNLGDISRWYFLDEFGIAETAGWVHVPGDAGDFANASVLYDHLEDNPAAHASFMEPVAVPGTDPDVVIVAIDSELILDLYDDGHDELATTYFERLASVLDAAPDDSWKMIAAHHPPVTYGKHGEPSFGSWVFGPGWPQFPTLLWKLPAPTVPLGAALGVVASPGWAAVAVVAPASTLIKMILGGSKQDVIADVNRRYAEALLRVSAAEGVDAILAGHDHNTQLIDLSEVEVAASNGGTDALLVITGAGSKVDPTRKGPGTVAFLADYSYVRMVQYPTELRFEVRNRAGAVVHTQPVRGGS